MENCDFAGIPHVPDKKLWNQLQATEKGMEWANQRVEEAEAKVKKMEDRMQLAKTKLGAQTRGPVGCQRRNNTCP